MGLLIAHPISLVVNDIRALLALPVSGRVATKAVASSATLAARHPIWRMTQKAKRLSTS